MEPLSCKQAAVMAWSNGCSHGVILAFLVQSLMAMFSQPSDDAGSADGGK